METGDGDGRISKAEWVADGGDAAVFDCCASEKISGVRKESVKLAVLQIVAEEFEERKAMNEEEESESEEYWPDSEEEELEWQRSLATKYGKEAINRNPQGGYMYRGRPAAKAAAKSAPSKPPTEWLVNLIDLSLECHSSVAAQQNCFLPFNNEYGHTFYMLRPVSLLLELTSKTFQFDEALYQNQLCTLLAPIFSIRLPAHKAKLVLQRLVLLWNTRYERIFELADAVAAQSLQIRSPQCFNTTVVRSLAILLEKKFEETRVTCAACPLCECQLLESDTNRYPVPITKLVRGHNTGIVLACAACDMVVGFECIVMRLCEVQKACEELSESDQDALDKELTQCSGCKKFACADCVRACNACHANQCLDCTAQWCVDCDEYYCRNCSSFCEGCMVTACRGCRKITWFNVPKNDQNGHERYSGCDKCT